MKLHRSILLPCLATLSLLLQSCATAPVATDEGQRPADGAKTSESRKKEEVLPLIGSLKVHRYRFDNGLKLLVVEDRSSPTFAYQTWFRVGSRDEDVGRTGLAHLFEHMMFKETKNLKDGEFDRTLEAAGAEGENAFTSHDYTAYVQELPKDKLDLIARLEAERMVNLVVNEKAFKTETSVVQNERRMRLENSPDGTMHQELFATAFTAHPYRWPVIGYQEDLDAMAADDARRFYTTWYSPNHATIVVVGDVDADEVRDTVEKHYGKLQRMDSPVRTLGAEPPQASPRRKNLKLNIQVEKLLMAYHIPDVTHEDMPKLWMLDTVLSGGKSSRLHRALVETGIATAAWSHLIENKDPGLFAFGASLQARKKAAQAEPVILKEIERLRNELVSPQELERARNRLSFSFYEGLNSNTEKAHLLGEYETITEGFETALAQYEKAKQVTPEMIQEVARKYLDPKNRTVITAAPKPAAPKK